MTQANPIPKPSQASHPVPNANAMICMCVDVVHVRLCCCQRWRVRRSVEGAVRRSGARRSRRDNLHHPYPRQVADVVALFPRTRSIDPTRPLSSFQFSNHPPLNHEFFSKNSFASFTLVAKYGLPPRSGWLSSISVRCALRTLSLVRLDSLLVWVSIWPGDLKIIL